MKQRLLLDHLELQRKVLSTQKWFLNESNCSNWERCTFSNSFSLELEVHSESSLFDFSSWVRFAWCCLIIINSLFQGSKTQFQLVLVKFEVRRFYPSSLRSKAQALRPPFSTCWFDQCLSEEQLLISLRRVLSSSWRFLVPDLMILPLILSSLSQT